MAGLLPDQRRKVVQIGRAIPFRKRAERIPIFGSKLEQKVESSKLQAGESSDNSGNSGAIRKAYLLHKGLVRRIVAEPIHPGSDLSQTMQSARSFTPFCIHL